MTSGRVCWLHREGAEHPVDLLVGVRVCDDRVVPADLRCARAFDGEDVLPVTAVNVGRVRS